MKKNLSNIISTVAHVVRLGGYRVGESPRKDWKYLMIILVVLIFFSGAVGGYVYWKVNDGSFFVPESTAVFSIESLDKQKLVNTVKIYEDKQKEFELFKANRASFVDPSI